MCSIGDNYILLQFVVDLLTGKNMKRIILIISLLSVLIFGTAISSAQEDHEMHTGTMECTTPDRMIMITTADTGFSFNTTTLNAVKGECLMIMFKNLQTSEHDFVINYANGTEWFGLHVMSNTEVTGDLPAGVKMAHLQIPDEDVTLDFYCSVGDGLHQNSGMEGEFVIGDGSPSEDGIPGFGLITSFVAISATFVTLKKKRNQA